VPLQRKETENPWEAICERLFKAATKTYFDRKSQKHIGWIVEELLKGFILVHICTTDIYLENRKQDRKGQKEESYDQFSWVHQTE
jgi:hypothetical protein